MCIRDRPHVTTRVSGRRIALQNAWREGHRTASPGQIRNGQTLRKNSSASPTGCRPRVTSSTTSGARRASFGCPWRRHGQSILRCRISADGWGSADRKTVGRRFARPCLFLPSAPRRSSSRWHWSADRDPRPRHPALFCFLLVCTARHLSSLICRDMVLRAK